MSGDRVLSQLKEYLEIEPEQLLGVVSLLSMLSPVVEVGLGIKPAPTGKKLTAWK